MITQQIQNNKGSQPHVNCVICHEDTKQNPKIVKLGTDFGVICEQCATSFSKDEIELMYHMFTVFGGYFGKLKSTQTSKYKILKEFVEDTQGFIQSNLAKDIKLQHKAFLFGISPRQFVQGLQVLQEK